MVVPTRPALYAYASEDAAWGTEQLGREVAPGLFGENRTPVGRDVTGALIGERWRIGDPASGVEVEVRMPRAPCGNLSHRLGLPGFHQRFLTARRLLRSGLGLAEPVRRAARRPADRTR